MQGTLVIITGSSGVGKSTLARALQEALLPEQWLHFSVDTLFECLPRSVVDRVNLEHAHALVDAKAIVAGAHACVRTLLDAGHRVIFDAVVLSERGALGLLGALGDHRPLIVEVTCEWDVIKARTIARGDRTLAEAAHGFEHGRGHLPAHHRLDSTETSPELLAARLAPFVRDATRSA